MPLKEQRILPDNCQLLIWDLQEDEGFFLKGLALEAWETEKLDRMKGRRRGEWLAGRWLIHLASGAENRLPCLIDEYGKPHLQKDNFELSLSHSHGLVAVLTGTSGLGLDIQKLVDKIVRIAHKFMRPEEDASLEEATKIEHLHVYWGAKEALYKAYGRRALDFKKHIHIQPFHYEGKGQTVGYILLENTSYKYAINYEKMEEYMLVTAYEIDPNTNDEAIITNH